MSLDEIIPSLLPQERKFLDKLDAELEKVESFYCDRESEMNERVQTLKRQMAELAEHRRVFHVPPSLSLSLFFFFFPSASAHDLTSASLHSNTTRTATLQQRATSKPSNLSTISSLPSSRLPFLTLTPFTLSTPLARLETSTTNPRRIPTTRSISRIRRTLRTALMLTRGEFHSIRRKRDVEVGV